MPGCVEDIVIACARNGDNTGIASWLAAIGTVGAVIVAIFGEALRHWFNRPVLSIDYDGSHADYHQLDTVQSQAPFHSNSKGHTYRIGIRNRGRGPALDVIVIVKSLEIEEPPSKWRTHPTFVQTELKWTHILIETKAMIPPGVRALCDLGGVQVTESGSKISCQMFLSTMVNPTNQYHILKDGRFRITLAVAGRNMAAMEQQICISFPTENRENPLDLIIM